MGRVEFLKWAGKQGWKYGQKYLNKAYSYFFDKGKIPDPKVILQKAKNYYDNFEGFKPTIVPKKPTTLGDALKTGTHTKVPTPKGLKPPSLKKSNVIPFPKKPPGKADGGRIDKALPTRSRDI